MTSTQWIVAYLVAGLVLIGPTAWEEAEGALDFVGLCIIAALFGAPMFCLVVALGLGDLVRNRWRRRRGYT